MLDEVLDRLLVKMTLFRSETCRVLECTSLTSKLECLRTYIDNAVILDLGTILVTGRVGSFA